MNSIFQFRRHYLFWPILLGLSVLLLVIYAFLSQTQANAYQVIKRASEDLHRVDVLLPQLDQQIDRLDHQIKSSASSNTRLSSTNEFVQYVEEQCQAFEVRLIQLPEEETKSMGEYQLAISTIEVEGRFHQMVSWMHHLEEQVRLGRIQHLSMRTEEIRTGYQTKTYLIVRMTFHRLLP